MVTCGETEREFQYRGGAFPIGRLSLDEMKEPLSRLGSQWAACALDSHQIRSARRIPHDTLGYQLSNVFEMEATLSSIKHPDNAPLPLKLWPEFGFLCAL